MHQVVRSLLLSAVRIYEGNEEALRSGQGRLANAYRTRWEDNDGSVTAQVQTPSSDQVSTSNAVGACSEGTTTGHVQPSESRKAAPVPTAMYGQAMHSPWRMNAEESWPQQVAVRHMPHDGVQGLPQSAHCHTSMATGAPIPPAQWLPTVDLHGRQDTMTPNIPLYSGLDQADRIVTPDGLCTTQDWNEAMRNTLAQFEDGSTDDWEKAAQEALAQFGDGYQMS
jgi:hypothetical protein